MAKKERTQNEAQELIVSQWKQFSLTDAYKDWIQSMDQYMALVQDNVDNMTESRPTAMPGITTKAPIDPVQAALMNQRKVGVRFCIEYAKLRVDS